MATHKPTYRMTTTEQIEMAYERSSHWLAEGNEASERGKSKKAEACYEKSQYWLDRALKLQGAFE